MAASRIISKTICRLVLVSAFLSVINEVAPSEPVVHLANWLLWLWAIGHLIDPMIKVCTWVLDKWRQRAE